MGRPDPSDAADYIASLVEELATVARSAQLNLLAYLLDVAALEAKTIAGKGPRVRDGRARLPDGYDEH